MEGYEKSHTSRVGQSQRWIRGGAMARRKRNRRDETAGEGEKPEPINVKDNAPREDVTDIDLKEDTSSEQKGNHARESKRQRTDGDVTATVKGTEEKENNGQEAKKTSNPVDSKVATHNGRNAETDKTFRIDASEYPYEYSYTVARIAEYADAEAKKVRVVRSTLSITDNSFKQRNWVGERRRKAKIEAAQSYSPVGRSSGESGSSRRSQSKANVETKEERVISYEPYQDSRKTNDGKSKKDSQRSVMQGLGATVQEMQEETVGVKANGTLEVNDDDDVESVCTVGLFDEEERADENDVSLDQFLEWRESKEGSSTDRNVRNRKYVSANRLKIPVEKLVGKTLDFKFITLANGVTLTCRTCIKGKLRKVVPSGDVKDAHSAGSSNLFFFEIDEDQMSSESLSELGPTTNPIFNRERRVVAVFDYNLLLTRTA